MDDPHKSSPPTSELKNILPDVVHSQQIATVGTVTHELDSTLPDTENSEENRILHDDDDSKTESISEHIPSKIEYSTDSDNATNTQGFPKLEQEQEKVFKNSSLTIPQPDSLASGNSTHDASRGSLSLPLDFNAVSDIQLLSEESPVNLAILSDLSKEPEQSHLSDSNINVNESDAADLSPKSDNQQESLNEESSKSSNEPQNPSDFSEKSNSPDKLSSGSEEIIRLDIRGQAAPKFPFAAAKIIFGPPPEGATIIEPNVEQSPVFPNLLSPFLVGAGDVKVEEVFDDHVQSKGPSPESLQMSPDKLSVTSEKSLPLSSDKHSYLNEKAEADLLVEEMTVEDELKMAEGERADESLPKSMPAEETMSFSTLTTDYKTICEEYHVKLVHLEAAITQRDELIEELTISLQRSVRERDEFSYENKHLSNEVSNLQHMVAEQSHSDHDTIKAQLSDFVKYQSMIKDDSTKFYSAIMSGGSSLQSSNGEKDMDREEIIINHSKSDLRSSDVSDEFQTGFESKLSAIINKFESYLEDNVRNKLRESLIQVLCDEIGKMRIDNDTEIKELENQMQQDKQAFSIETRRLRELLASVKAGNADIDLLRQELAVKHEKEMENLRTYFEKKCSDMERSYSEEVWRGKCASPGGSASSLDAEASAAGAGDAPRRTRSADLPSLTLESSQLEQAVKQVTKKYEQQLDEQKAEHMAYVEELKTAHREAIAALDEQVTQLKAHIHTSENTESNVALYQQDIDLELEKKMEVQLEQRLEEVRDEVRQEVVNHLQEQLQVLLSDPDAEVSSWPLELVALRDKIYGDAAKAQQEKECSSLRDELSVGEDKWKQRRNVSFDQNRQLEEVTKERDDLKRVAVSLHRVVGQLVAYCASAEDELNRTVLAQLLSRLLPEGDETFAEESRPTTPNLSGDLNNSVVSRSGKHVHFAPDLNVLLADLDEEGLVTFLQQQRDLSADIKKELESSLRRLRHEAHSLLDLSAKLTNKSRPECKMLESSQVQITELVEDLESKQKNCENCDLHRKNMEEAMAECLQRENLLRADLEAAMIKIAQLMTSADVIAEGYGTGPDPEEPLARPRGGSGVGGGAGAGGGGGAGAWGALSLDALGSPRHQRLQHDLDTAQRERDDYRQQLEAANRQLRSTRQFVEEQAGEREAERDEFARRLADLRGDNARLAARLHNNARILAEVEQLEAQTRDMNQVIAELEARKISTDEELKASEEKISLLRDIIANLESQLEQKTTHEHEILEQLEQMKKTIDDRDGKMRNLLLELESMKSEKLDQSDVVCVKCGQEEEKTFELLERVREQCRYLEQQLHRRTRRLERLHEQTSASCSEPSEDVSLRDHRDTHLEAKSPDTEPSPRFSEHLSELAGVWECLQAHSRAVDAALKRVADLEMQRTQLKDIAQEVRAERDVLQARMSEQALKISSLSARLQQQRNDAEALSHQATSQLSVQLHDALAEVQRLKEELESKDKQLIRVKQNLEEREKLHDEHHSLYGNSCNPKDKVIILERELSNAQTRIAQLECLTKSLEKDKDELQTSIRDLQRGLAEKEDQLQELLALKLEEENQKDDRNDVLEGKTSARTLSDIVSISEFDEQDLQMRRAELRAHNVSLTGAPYIDIKERTLNRTLPPEFAKANMSSLNIELVDHFDIPGYTPRADSLPAHLTSTQNRDFLKDYKRNVNETTMFGIDVKHAQTIPDNCSMYPNREATDSKDISVEPKRINFSLEATDNKTHDELNSLRELGITLDLKQSNFPDVLSQLKSEIKKSRTELENAKSELKNAEEQLCEFPALKEEVEELKGLLENTMATMANDKKFYENQLENFTSNKKLLEQRLTELTQEVNDKSKDLHLLKEDILRRENMILELAKEKRNLTNKMTELEVKIDELQSKNSTLEKYESENHQMREKVNEVQKLHQLVSEKNQQIDSLNQHLDRLDDLQRTLNDRTEELDNIKEAHEEKSNEVFHLQDTIEALNRDLTKLNEENDKLNAHTKDLVLKLTKLEKEQENASLRLQSNECELERMSSLNRELTAKIDELKLLTDKLKDKETEIEILHEDINAFHEEIASLKEQLKMVSRSPSPRNKNGEDKKCVDRQASNDKKNLVKIRKHVSLLQHELDFNKKELNDKAFELAKAKLDVTELKSNLSQANKELADKDMDNVELRQQTEQLQQEIRQLMDQKDLLQQQFENVVSRMREESNVGELKNKLREKAERCQELEVELENLRELMGRSRAGAVQPPSPLGRALAVRSPTAELERALRDQLDYSHTLDEDIMDQILSASSDEREDIPRLALNTSKSSSSIHSSSSDRINRLKSDNEKLQMHVNNLESRLKDKDALITELNRVRDKLVSECQTSQLRYESERDNAGRLQLLLDTHKDTADSLQNQDSNMIQILKKRLESAMASELDLQQREQQARARLAQLERQLLDQSLDNNRQDPLKAQLTQQIETSERLKGEMSVLKSKLDVERSRYQDLQAMLDYTRLHSQKEIDAKNEMCTSLKNELAEMKRVKHESGKQLVRAKQLVSTQAAALRDLELRLAQHKPAPLAEALTEIESTKTELNRELATLKKCLLDSNNPELMTLRQEKQQLTAKVEQLEKETQAKSQQQPDEKDQAIRYLHGRCLRLESCRKALVWQKRYLQRVLAGYTEFEKKLRLPSSGVPEVSRGKKRFKCIATVVVIVVRMGFLVRRRQHVRALAAQALVRPAPTHAPTPAPAARSAQQCVSVGGYSATPPPSHRSADSTATPTTPACRAGGGGGGGGGGGAASMARRAMQQDMRLNLSASPSVGDLIRRSPYTANSPHNDPFVLNSPRGEAGVAGAGAGAGGAGAYLHKLELVSRCLSRALEPRHVP